jgi:hypothetical protein
MNWKREQKFKEDAAPQQCEETRPDNEAGLQERLRSRLNRAQRDAQKGEQIAELLYLLDRHPEMARILELFEAVGH